MFEQLTQLVQQFGQDDVVKNNAIPVIPIEIAKLTNLKNLLLEKNQFKKFPVELCTLTNLAALDLDDNQFKTLPKEIINLINLKELYLGVNPWVGFPETIYPFLEKLEFGQATLVKKLIQTKL